MKRPKPPLVPDPELWAEVTRAVKPLRRRGKPAPAPASTAEPPVVPRAPAAKPKPPARPKAPPPPLDSGAPAGLDRRKAERLRKGQLPIEAVLDLHGMTQDRAHAALTRFLERTAAAGLRCVLVITGQGRTKTEGGVLKREVPRWMNEPGLRPLILAISAARPQHGGGGALYVLLKRRREPA